MKIFIKGKSEISLSDSDFIAEGGQGKVYGKNGIAYKIYNDQSLMIPSQKFDELSKIQNDNVIRPLDVILHTKTNKPIGYTMRLLDNGTTTPLAQMFTKGFKNKYGILPEDVLKLVKDMQKTYSEIHKENCLVIDGNELNFKVDNNLTRVFFLDADSFQTPSYPATFQMESIKDWHTKGFNENTDWFAWGIVTFNLLIGIHPFKGFHKKYKDDFIERMKKNISIFDKDVLLPPVVHPFSVIPETLKNYYKAIFQDGKRLPPPEDYIGLIVITPINSVQHISGTNNFEIIKLETCNDEIIGYVSTEGIKVIITKEIAQKAKSAIKIAISQKYGRTIFSYLENKRIILKYKDKINFPYDVEQITSYDGRIYYKQSSYIYQIEFHETINSIIATPRQIANVHENNTRLFDGMAIMSLMGKPHIVIFPENNTSYTLAIQEIKGTIIDAKYDNRIAMIVTSESGKYKRLVLRVSKDFKGYEIIQTVNDITYVGLNFITLNKGICCNINESGEFELFTNQTGNSLMKVISDPVIKSDITLVKDNDNVLFFKGKDIYSLKMK